LGSSVNLEEKHPDISICCEELLSSAASAWTSLAPPNFRDVTEGWRYIGCVAPYVRISEVAAPAGGPQ
jgi:hypothetical protein